MSVRTRRAGAGGGGGSSTSSSARASSDDGIEDQQHQFYSKTGGKKKQKKGSSKAGILLAAVALSLAVAALVIKVRIRGAERGEKRQTGGEDEKKNLLFFSIGARSFDFFFFACDAAAGLFFSQCCPPKKPTFLKKKKKKKLLQVDLPQPLSAKLRQPYLRAAWKDLSASMPDLLSQQGQGVGRKKKSLLEIDVENSRPLFDWGVASSAYQIEGAWNLDGKGPSIWDAFSHTPGKVRREVEREGEGRRGEEGKERERERAPRVSREREREREKTSLTPGKPRPKKQNKRNKKKVLNNETGDVACDFYHLYSKDIAMMRSLGAKSFRFSLAWSRLLPEGRGRINEEGFRFYEKVLDALEEAGIEPHVTLYHW